MATPGGGFQREQRAVRYAFGPTVVGQAGAGPDAHVSVGQMPEELGAAGLGLDELSLDGDGPDELGGAGPAGRTEALINHGRQRARRSRTRRVLAHWRMLLVGAVALLAGVISALVALGGGSASWPASVATVQTEIKQACQNPDVAAEPSGLNFACAKDTQQVLWVFSLLTSGNNPGYLDQATGRKGLEPIQPAQGGDIAWSLNLHHPYNAANPLDSLEVAARAINNIIGGATLTSSSGGALVEGGLESTAANCERYTGSARLVTRQGYPARCAAPVTPGLARRHWSAMRSSSGWAGHRRRSQRGGVLFENADNPGNPKVQAILEQPARVGTVAGAARKGARRIQRRSSAVAGKPGQNRASQTGLQSPKGGRGSRAFRQEAMVAAGNGACDREHWRRDYRAQLHPRGGHDDDLADQRATPPARPGAGGAARHARRPGGGR